MSDLRTAWRGLVRAPVFTVVSMATVAIGIGATTAMLSVGHALLLRAPPILEPDRVVSVWEERSGSVRQSTEGRQLPHARIEAYRDATRDVFVDLAGHSYNGFALGTGDGAVEVDGFVTTASYFGLLGLTPTLGRLYDADDAASVVISERLWRARFAADPDVVGRTVTLNSRTFTVVAVAPTDFVGTMTLFTGDLWVPWRSYTEATEAGPNAIQLVPIARLRPGIDRAAAEERVAAIARTIPPASSSTTVRGARFDRLQWHADVQGVLSTGSLAMLLAAGLLLLTACVNLAGMTMARAHDRFRELAVRLAIGAGRARLVRQMLAESVLLAACGGAAGVGLAYLGTAMLSSVTLPVGATLTIDLTPDPRVLVASAAVTMLTGILFGLGPALRSTGQDLSTSLKEGATGPDGRLRRAFHVGGQVALCTVVLVTAGLFVRSQRAVLDVPLGFDPRGVVVGEVVIAPHGYSADEGRVFFAELLDRVRALPGVEAAGLGRFVLLGGSNSSTGARAAEDGAEGAEVVVGTNTVDAGYFTANDVELVEGRLFDATDAESGPPVTVVNRRLAERLWPGTSAVGRTVRMRGEDHRVVGVVEDGVYVFASETPAAFAFFPLARRYVPTLSVHVLAPGREGEVATELRRVVADLDPDVAVAVRSYEEVVAANRFGQTVAATLATLLGMTTLLLAMLGVYGLLAVQVAQRAYEFGIRMAVGAKALDVLLLVVRRGLSVALAGGAVGVVLAATVTRSLGGLLYDVSPLDPTTFIVVPVLLAAAAGVAALVPARRATRVSPTVALRGE